MIFNGNALYQGPPVMWRQYAINCQLIHSPAKFNVETLVESSISFKVVKEQIDKDSAIISSLHQHTEKNMTS